MTGCALGPGNCKCLLGSRPHIATQSLPGCRLDVHLKKKAHISLGCLREGMGNGTNNDHCISFMTKMTTELCNFLDLLSVIAGAGNNLSASDRIKKKNTRSRFGHIEILMMMKSFYKFLSFYFPPLVIRDVRIVKEQGVRSFSKGTVEENSKVWKLIRITI